MPGGRFWGALFFLFLFFAALSTVTAVFENILACWMDRWNISRGKAVAANLVLILLLSLPCLLGNNLWSGVQILGMSIMDFEDVLCGNFGSFTGRKMSIPEFLERYPGGTVDVMDEMYGYNQAWISGFLNYGSKCYEIQLEFYYAGDFCYLLRA